MIVADANLIAYLMLKGPFFDRAQRVLKRDRHWVAPPLWRYEFLNVVATTVRIGSLEERLAKKVISQASHIVRGRDHGRPWVVVSLSVSTKIATYDCEYVVLAKKLQVLLVTADKGLLKAFPETAISIEQFASGS